VPLRLLRRHLTCANRRWRWLARALAVTGLACAPVTAAGVPALAATVNPPPGSRPAGHGAKPRTPPTPPPVRSSASVISADLLQDGALSAGILIVLLIPITWYGSVARRRDRKARVSVQRRAGTGDTELGPDPLLEYFGPEPGNPAESEPPRRPSPKFQPRPALAGRSTLTSAFGSPPLLAAPPSPSGYGQVAQGPSGPERSAAGQTLGPDYRGPAPRYPAGRPQAIPPRPATARPAAPRPAAAPWPAAAPSGGTAAGPGADAWANADRPYPAPGNGAASGAGGGGADVSGTGVGRPGGTPPTLHRAPVSGSPPWGPAPRPTSELPWAMAPGPYPGLPAAAPGRPGVPAPGALGRQAPVSQYPSGGQAPGGQFSPAPDQPDPAAVARPGAAAAGQPSHAAAQAGPRPAVHPGTGPERPARLPNRSSAPRSIFDPEPGTFDLPENQGGRRPHDDSGSRPIYTWNPEGESA
jgi:hypothetical protein